MRRDPSRSSAKHKVNHEQHKMLLSCFHLSCFTHMKLAWISLLTWVLAALNECFQPTICIAFLCCDRRFLVAGCLDLNPSIEKVFCMTFGLLLYSYSMFKSTKTDPVLVVPKGLRWRIIKMFHDDVGHPAVENVLKKACKSFWFPRMRNFVKSYIKSCVECAYHPQPKRKGSELHGMDVPQLPFEVMHLDHIGPFGKSKKGFEYVLVCVDALTRYVLIYHTHTNNKNEASDRRTESNDNVLW